MTGLLCKVTIAALLFVGLTGGSAASSCLASYYGNGEALSRRTANGDVFDRTAMTAAHRSYPFGTKLRVTYRGKSVIVRVNDRGPAARTGRCLDLSYGAARRIGLLHAGVGRVTIHRH